jgi:hypothetical protein
MSRKEAASLSAALLARKGSAAPAGFTPLAITGGKRGLPRASALLRQAALSPPPQDHWAKIGDTGTSEDRARVTLWLNEARHFRLKLASAHMQQSLQEILTTALDHYLDQVGPEILREGCICLATGAENRRNNGR